MNELEHTRFLSKETLKKILMTGKTDAKIDLVFGGIILVVGTSLVVIWSIGESFGLVSLGTIGKWGLGLLPIIIEIIRVVLRGGFK